MLKRVRTPVISRQPGRNHIVSCNPFQSDFFTERRFLFSSRPLSERHNSTRTFSFSPGWGSSSFWNTNLLSSPDQVLDLPGQMLDLLRNFFQLRLGSR